MIENRSGNDRRNTSDRRKNNDGDITDNKREGVERRINHERRDNDSSENKLVLEIEALQLEFTKTTEKLIKDVKRQDKIMARSDKRQQREYDELQNKLKEVKDLSKEIEETQKEVILTMGAIGESRSRETGNHVKRVAEYSKILALNYGLSEEEAELLKQVSPMHDIGKVGIPDSILNKPGRLTFDEKLIMNSHADLGYDMLKYSKRKLLKTAAIVAHEHHENWDGSGYPRGLKGEEIHIYGRITALADVFDALGTGRVYKDVWEDEKIFQLFRDESGKHFDPKLVDIFFENVEEFLAIRVKFVDFIK